MAGAGEEEPPARAAWENKVQFMLSIIGYSVGLGNIWRFPYLCQQNGGGAFLIPFVIMLVLEGIPLFLIELGIGQKMRLGAVGVWNTIHPWLGGLGVASCTVTFFVALYYNVIITWCFYYLFNSFQTTLPWAECPKTANGSLIQECERSSATAYFWYRTTLDVSPSIGELDGLKWWIVGCLLLAWVVVFFIVMKGIQSSGKVVYITSIFPYLVLTIFFIRGITLKGAGAGLMHMYTPKVEKLLNPTVWLEAATQVFYSFGLAFGSLIAFGSYNPPKNNCVRDVILVSITNAMTAIYASLVVFAILGFKAYVNVEKCILNAAQTVRNINEVWGQGTINEWFQKFRSGDFDFEDEEGRGRHSSVVDDQLSNKEEMVKMGVLPNLNVTNEYYEEKLKTVMNSSSIMECDMQKQLDQAAEGTGLAFIVFTQAIVELPGAPFWAIIFFMMLLSLGIGSQIGILEGMLSCIFDIDFFKRIRKPILTGFVCSVCFIVGLIFTTGAGQYWLEMVDSFAATIGLVMIALLEMVAVMYIYGHEKFTQDIEDMTGYRPGTYWQVTWRFLAPTIMTCILTSSILFRILKDNTYSAWDAAKGQTYPRAYPGWVMGIAITIISASIFPIVSVFLLRRFQVAQLDVDIHQGAIRRIDTTVSTREMMRDVDVDEYDSQEEFEEEEDDRGGKSFKMEVMEF